MDGGVCWPPPDHLTLLAKAGQFKTMFNEPHESLPRASQLGDLVEDQTYGLLHAAIRILLEPVTSLHEADRSGDDKFAAPCLLIACRKGTLSEEIEFVFVRLPFRPSSSRSLPLRGAYTVS